jgi:hypothetical protein
MLDKITKRAARRPTKPRRTITQLYADFEKAVAAMEATPSTSGNKLSNPAFDRATDKCANIGQTIMTTPANSIDEMLLRIRVVGWSTGIPHNGSLANLDHWDPAARGNSEEFQALASLRAELRLLKANPAAFGRIDTPITHKELARIRDLYKEKHKELLHEFRVATRLAVGLFAKTELELIDAIKKIDADPRWEMNILGTLAQGREAAQDFVKLIKHAEARCAVALANARPKVSA